MERHLLESDGGVGQACLVEIPLERRDVRRPESDHTTGGISHTSTFSSPSVDSDLSYSSHLKTPLRQRESTTTNDEESVERTKLNDQYVRNTWLAFFLILVVLFAAEAGLIMACLRVSPSSPLSLIIPSAGDIEQSYQVLMSPQTPGKEKISTLLRMKKSLDVFVIEWRKARAIGDTVFMYQCIATSVNMSVVLCTAVLAYQYRTQNAVKSRGWQFLVQAYVSGLLFQAANSVPNAGVNLKLVELPDVLMLTDALEMQNSLERMRNVTCAFICLSLVFGCFFVGAFMQRQRILSYVFGHRVRRRIRATFMQPLPVHVFISLCSMVPIIVWRIKGSPLDEATGRWLVAGFWFAGGVYGMWLCNARVVTYWCIVVYTLLLYMQLTALTNFIAFDLGLMAACRSAVTLAALDNAVCAMVQARLSSGNSAVGRLLSGTDIGLEEAAKYRRRTMEHMAGTMGTPMEARHTSTVPPLQASV